MGHVCLTVALLSGQTATARQFMQQLNGARQREFDASERRLGITREIWYLAPPASGDHLVGYIESADFGRALTSFDRPASVHCQSPAR